MRTLAECEAWAQEQGAVLKVNFAEGVASLQVGGFKAHSSEAMPLEPKSTLEALNFQV
jgi:hypothetical protein